MSDFLEQLGGDEAVLLMYLAGELGPADHAVVDRRLLTDATFAAALDRLRDTDERFRTGLASLDAATPLPIDPAVATRNVSRLLRRRQARPASPAQPAATSRAFPRWAFPAAAAAAVLIVASLLWRTFDEAAPGRRGAHPIANVTPDADSIEMAAATSLMRDTEDWALASGIARVDGDDLAGTGMSFDFSSDLDAAQP